MQYVIGFFILFTLSLTGCGGTISGYISSSSTPDVTLSTDKMSYEVTEGEDVDLRVALDQVLTSELSIYWTLEDPNASGPFGLFGTNLSSNDFSALSGRLNVTPGLRQILLKIPSLADLTYENAEEFDLVLTTGTEKEHRVKVRVLDSDSKPTVSLSTATVTEGQTTAIQVNFSKRSAYKTTLNYEIVPGSATLGAEFASLTGSFEVDPNTLLTNLSIPILDDGDVEGNEYFQIKLTTADHAVVDTTLVSIIIFDDEDGPKLAVEGQIIDESGGTLRVKVTYADISQVRTLPVYFDWSIVDGDANEADDFVAAGGTGVVIYPGENEVYLDIPIIDDLKYELDEAFDVVLSNVVNAGLAVDQATVTITDNDPMPELEWQIAQTSALESAFGTFSVTAKLNQASGFDVTATVATSGTATAQDFNLPTTQITIPAGATEANFVVQIIEDSAVASDKELILTLGGLTNAQAGTQLNHTIEIIDDDGAPLMFVSNTSFNESAGTGFVVVSLSKPLEISESVDFSYSAADGSAGTLDYTLTAGSATINGGESSYSIPITINDDNIYEGNEQLTVSVSSSDPDVSIQPGSETGYVTIVDNDAAPIIEFAQASSTAAENIGSAVTITVNKTGQTNSTSTVSYIIGGTATYAADGSKDHRLSSGTLSFLSGETSKTISVVIDDDSLQEGNETIVVTLVNPTSATLGSIQTHTLTITDDESLPHVSVAGASTTEGVDAEFTVTLTVAVGYPVSVDYVISDGTAVSPDDHAGGSGQFTIYPGDGLSKKIYVATVDDVLYEGDETLDILISNPDPSSVIIDTATDTSTIVDNEGTPTLTISDATINEGSPGVVTVTVDPVSTQAITVNYASSDISATAGSDYTAVSGTLTIPAGDSTANINLTSSDDSIYEGDETFSMALSLPSVDSQLGTPSTGTVTITDNEAMPQVQFGIANQTVNEGDGTATVTVELNRVSTQNVTVAYTLSGTASEGVSNDYTISPASVTIAAGQTQTDLTVTLNDDAAFEGSESIILTLGTPSGADIGSIIAHTITVEDNESTPTLTIDDISIIEGASGSLTVSVSPVSSQAITVNYASSNGTATAGSDYTALSNTLTIPAGQGSATISVVTLDDSVFEGDEAFSVALSTPSAGSQLGTPFTGTVTITDNESTPEVQFSLANQTVNEGDGTVTVTVELNQASSQSVTVPYTLSGAATEGAAADYTILPASSVSIAAGQTQVDLTITLIDDAEFEGSEEIILTLGTPTGAGLGTIDVHTVTVQDNESTPTLTIDDTSIIEGAAGTLTVTVTPVSSQAITVNYASSNVTATAGSDYTALSNTLTIPAGQSTGTINITTLDDSVFEGDETFSVALSTPSAGSQLGTPATGTVTITDNDSTPEVEFSVASQTVNEGDGTATVTIEMLQASSQNVTIPYTISGTATEGAGADYTISPTSPVTILAGQTQVSLTITLNDDSGFEADETIVLTLGTPTGANLGTTTTHTVTILNDDTMPVVQFSSASQTIAGCGGTATVTLTLDQTLIDPVTVPYTLSGAAVEGVDYTISSASPVTISAGLSQMDLTVTIIDDTYFQSTKDIVITLGSPTGATLGTTTTHTITAPNLSTIGLDLDFMNSSSWSGSGTTWADLNGLLNHNLVGVTVEDYGFTLPTASNNSKNIYPAVSTCAPLNFMFRPGSIEWTYSLWFKPKTGSYNSFRHNGGKLSLMGANNGTVAVAFRDAASVALVSSTTPAILSFNSWQLVSFVVSETSGNVKIYKNGVYQGALSLSTTGLTSSSTANFASVGFRSWSDAGSLTVAGIHISGQAMTDTELLALTGKYEAGRMISFFQDRNTVVSTSPGATYTSSGFTNNTSSSIDFTISGTGSPQLLINGVPSGTSATVGPGETLSYQLTANAVIGGTESVTLSSNGYSASITLTSIALINVALDFMNPSSWSGSGSTWTDLGGVMDFTLTGVLVDNYGFRITTGGNGTKNIFPVSTTYPELNSMVRPGSIEWTYSLWFMPASGSYNSFRHAYGGKFNLMGWNDRRIGVGFSAAEGGTIVSSTTTALMTFGKWQLVSFVVSETAGNVKVYKNGVLQGTLPISISGLDGTKTASFERFGFMSWGDAGNLSVAGIELTNQVLSDAELLEMAEKFESGRLVGTLGVDVTATAGATYTSAALTNDTSSSVDVSISGGGSPQLLINGVPSGTTATVTPGDTLAYEMTANAGIGGTETVTLSSYGYSVDFVVTSN